MKSFILILANLYSLNIQAGIGDNYEWGGFTKKLYDGAVYTKDEIVDKWQTTGGKKGIPGRGPEGFYIEETSGPKTTGANTSIKKIEKKRRLYTPDESTKMMTRYFANYKCDTKNRLIDFSMNKANEDKKYSTYQYASNHNGSAVIFAKLSERDSIVWAKPFTAPQELALEVYYDCFCNRIQKLYQAGYKPLCLRVSPVVKELVKDKEVNQGKRTPKEIIYDDPTSRSEEEAQTAPK